MREQQNASTAQEEGLNLQVCINFNGRDDCIEIPADREWHLIGYSNGNIVFDSVEVHNRILNEDEINSTFQYLEIIQIEFYQKKK